MFVCRVCGYDRLDSPQYLEQGEPNFVICSCCGFESGFDDLDQGITIEAYRNTWLADGANWLNQKEKPDNWNLDIQLQNIWVFLKQPFIR